MGEYIVDFVNTTIKLYTGKMPVEWFEIGIPCIERKIKEYIEKYREKMNYHEITVYASKSNVTLSHKCVVYPGLMPTVAPIE